MAKRRVSSIRAQIIAYTVTGAIFEISGHTARYAELFRECGLKYIPQMVCWWHHGDDLPLEVQDILLGLYVLSPKTKRERVSELRWRIEQRLKESELEQ